MQLLVTGSAGLVGRELVAALRLEGHRIVEIDAADGQSDIRDGDRMRQAMAGCDGVIHMAAISRVAWGERYPELCHSINVDGTRVLLDLALAADTPPWFLFVSSREVYGNPDRFPVREDAPMQPENHYGRSKAEGERLVNAARVKGLRTGIVRLSNVYGTTYDHPDRAVPSLLWRALAGQELRISGAETFFDFVHVADCVRGLERMAELLSQGESALPPVHLVTGAKTSLGDLAAAAIRVTGSDSPVRNDPPRSFDVAGFCGDPEMAREVLDWTASVDLDTGLRELLEALHARATPPDPVEVPDFLIGTPVDAWA
jgi:nucleoside-diphosphate-sugar epimerase